MRGIFSPRAKIACVHVFVFGSSSRTLALSGSTTWHCSISLFINVVMVKQTKVITRVKSTTMVVSGLAGEGLTSDFHHFPWLFLVG